LVCTRTVSPTRKAATAPASPLHVPLFDQLNRLRAHLAASSIEATAFRRAMLFKIGSVYETLGPSSPSVVFGEQLLVSFDREAAEQIGPAPRVRTSACACPARSCARDLRTATPAERNAHGTREARVLGPSRLSAVNDSVEVSSLRDARNQASHRVDDGCAANSPRR